MDAAIARGGVIAYPTEAVWGLGCDPTNEAAVRRLFALKQRPEGVGLILIAADVRQVEPYLGDCPAAAKEAALATWPGPHTWIFPRSTAVPSWVVGSHAGVAVRVTAHPVARALCQAYGAAIVSTSANTHGQSPARSIQELRQMFGRQLDDIVEGELGGLERPTAIRDAVSGEVARH
jgi:L-threonylcarbamoyladenylate synthase